MLRNIGSIFLGLALVISITIPVYAKGGPLNGQPFQTLEERVAALEVICQPPFSLVGELEPHEGVSQIVCGSEALNTPATLSYRQLIQDTVVTPVCLTADTLTSGLQVTLKTYLENALNVAAEESAQWTANAINDSQAAVVAALNAVLAAQANGTNAAMSSLTSGINVELSNASGGFNEIDHDINLVNDRVGQGVNKLKDRVRDFIKSLDDPDYMPDFINEGHVHSFFNNINPTPGNLDIPDINLGSITAPTVPTLFVEAIPVSIDVQHIDVDISELLEQVLDAVNLCTYPDEYTDLILAIFGFEDAIDIASGNAGIPEQVPALEDAVQMCAVRGGHICTKSELGVLGVTPSSGDWAGGPDSAVVWMPGTALYSTPWPPIQQDAGALFNFPRKVPFNVSSPVYPTGNFSCCTNTIR